jgi:hypothetical protein
MSYARSSGVLVAALTFFVGQGSAFGADYGAKGPESSTEVPLDPQSTGATGGTLLVPTGAGPYPVLVVSHGFSASASNQIGWGRHLASWGFIVAVPTFPGSTHATNGAVIAKTAVAARAAGGAKASKRLGLMGHSAGGLATVLAAESAKPDAIVLFDPVDNSDAGKAALANVCAPVLTLFANPGGCNKEGGWKAFGGSSKGPSTTVSVVGSTHCDGELPDRGVACALFCGGGASAERQVVLARYATAHFMAKLRGAADATQALTQTSLDADVALVGASVRQQSACDTQVDGTTEPPGSAPPPAGGATQPGSGAASANPPVTPPSAQDPSPAGSTAPGASDSSGSCSLAYGGRTSMGLGGGALLVLLALCGRRRGRKTCAGGPIAKPFA